MHGLECSWKLEYVIISKTFLQHKDRLQCIRASVAPRFYTINNKWV